MEAFVQRNNPAVRYQKRAKPASTSTTHRDDVTAHDILLGKGKSTKSHIGNVAFQALGDVRIEAYKAATSRGVKINMIVRLASSIEECGGRFLLSGGGPSRGMDFTSVDQAYAREKIGNSIRDGVKLLNKGKRRVNSVAARFDANSSFDEIVQHLVLLTQQQPEAVVLPPQNKSPNHGVARHLTDTPPKLHACSSTASAHINSLAYLQERARFHNDICQHGLCYVLTASSIEQEATEAPPEDSLSTILEMDADFVADLLLDETQENNRKATPDENRKKEISATNNDSKVHQTLRTDELDYVSIDSSVGMLQSCIELLEADFDDDASFLAWKANADDGGMLEEDDLLFLRSTETSTNDWFY